MALNRAVAVAEVESPETALALVDGLDLHSYDLFHALPVRPPYRLRTTDAEWEDVPRPGTLRAVWRLRAGRLDCPIGYADMSDATQRANTSIFSVGQGPSQGMEPSRSRSRMVSACSLTSP